MLEDDALYLHDLLVRWGACFRSAYTIATGKEAIEHQGTGRLVTPGPPLLTDLTFDGVRLNILPRMLYGAHVEGVNADVVVDAWEEGVAMLAINATLSSLRERLHEVFPFFPFSGTRKQMLVQFLYAAGWHFGRTRIAGRRAVLRLYKGGSIGFDGRALLHLSGHTRPPAKGRSESCAPALSAVRAPRLLSLARTCAVHAALAEALPALNREVDLIFASAILAGRPLERTLNAAVLDVDADDDDDSDAPQAPRRARVHRERPEPEPEPDPEPSLEELALLSLNDFLRRA